MGGRNSGDWEGSKGLGRKRDKQMVGFGLAKSGRPLTALEIYSPALSTANKYLDSKQLHYYSFPSS